MEASFDLALPIECDDEYWDPEDPTQAFKQPAGKPSLVSAFVSMIKLQQIQACTLRTVVSRLPRVWLKLAQCSCH